MSEELTNWGELCAKAGIEVGDTPTETSVRRLISGGALISSSSLSNPEPACSAGSCCPGGVCGIPD